MGKSRKKIYILFISELNLCKIGISENVEKRVKQLQTGCPFKIDIVKKYDSPISSRIEKIIHRRYDSRKLDDNDYNLVGEWFNLTISEVLSFEETCNEIETGINILKAQGNPFI